MKTLWLVGMGPGDPDLATFAARKALEQADVLIGADRLLQELGDSACEKRFALTRANDILDLLASDSTWENAAVALSGDTGMFSGAKLLLERAEERLGCTVKTIPGVGSASYFASRLGLPWQGWKTVSAHGIDCDVAAEVAENREVFLVTGGANPVRAICERLTEAGLGKVRVYAGEQLSYPEERITQGSAEELAAQDFHSLSVMLCVNDKAESAHSRGINDSAASACSREPRAAGAACSREPEAAGAACSREPRAAGAACSREPGAESASYETTCAAGCDEVAGRWPWKTPGIPDDLFVRGKVPMTKQEVRAVAVSKLRVAQGECIYDIGAGTGSVTIELALLAGRDGRIEAIERNPEGCTLIRENARNFGLDTVHIAEGLAPDCMEGLPAPHAAFIGGSGSNLKQICDALLAKNPRVRICVTAVTLQTLADATAILTQAPFTGFECSCLNVSRAQELGSYQLMKAENPIYVMCAQGASEADGATDAEQAGQYDASSSATDRTGADAHA